MGEGKAAVAHSWLTLLPARQITDFHTADCGSCIDADQMLRNEKASAQAVQLRAVCQICHP